MLVNIYINLINSFIFKKPGREKKIQHCHLEIHDLSKFQELCMHVFVKFFVAALNLLICVLKTVISRTKSTGKGVMKSYRHFKHHESLNSLKLSERDTNLHKPTINV